MAGHKINPFGIKNNELCEHKFFLVRHKISLLFYRLGKIDNRMVNFPETEEKRANITSNPLKKTYNMFT